MSVAISSTGARRPLFDSVVRRVAVVFAVAVAFIVPATAASADMSVGQDTIVGGTDAPSIGTFQHIALLNANGGQCGGSLITPEWIMTAAHCFFDNGVQSVPNSGAGLTATLNTLTQDPLSAGAEVRTSNQLIIHPDYNMTTQANDIAVFRITEPSAMTPTKLGTSSNASLWSAGKLGTARGWGLTTDGGEVANNLQQVQLPIISDAACNATAIGPISDALMICAGDVANGGIDTCQGDSGGPLSVADPAGGWITFGVVSFGAKCAEANSPGVYVEVQAYGAWLAQNVPGLDAPTPPNPNPNPNPNPTPGNGFTPVGPVRAGDTRDGARPGAGSTVTFNVGSQYAGQSISVNLTVAGAQGRGFATLYACDADQPGTSSLNYQAGQAVANGVITKVSATGTVCVFVSQSAHVILDVFGVFSSDAFTAVGPDRAGDTRNDGGGILASGEVFVVDVGSQYAGQSISVNLTVAGAQGRGFATLYACDVSQPGTSSLNYQAGQAVANGVITKVSADGEVCVFVSQSAHVILDVFGSFSSSAFTPVGPIRAGDSRNGDGIPAAGEVIQADVGSQYAGQSISVNLTVAGAQGRGFATLFACDVSQPGTSSLNFQAGQAVANGVITKVSATGTVCAFVSQSAHVILDVFGSFSS